jgi:DNA-binding NtrC family response regulator
MNRAATAELDQAGNREPNHASEDEAIAAGCSLPLLITASSAGAVEALARRVHAAGFGAPSPFIPARARALPIDPGMLRETWSNLTQAATGGSLLLNDVEDMPASVQDRLIELLVELEGARARAPSAAVRLMAGTTVSLYDRIVGGTFSERLFYRLNIIHLVARNAAQ